MKSMKLFSMSLLMISGIFLSCNNEKSREPVTTLESIARDYGQFAPEDAFPDGSEFAYYGSENEWSRRMFSGKSADRYYKRRGQRQLLAILDGQPEEAVEMCRQRLISDPDDTESYFMLTIAWTRMGEIDKAIGSMNQALKAGIPFERFLAGPRDMLQPLYNSREFKELAASKEIQIIHGPLLGTVTGSSARFWVRSVEETAVGITVFEKENRLKVISSASDFTKAEKDYTAVIEITDLPPGTTYAYNVIVNSRPQIEGELPEFRTNPLPGDKQPVRIGFGGGAGFTPDNERIWDTIRSGRPDAFLLLGDNVYIDLPESPGAFHNYTYYRRQSQAEFRNLVRSTPIYSIWDDHDAATDDIWLGPYPDRPSWKLPMLKVFQNNWNNPGYGNEAWPGTWFQFDIADVELFMLDGRMYRTNPFEVPATMLGPVQKKWLFDGLSRSTATFKVIVSPVPWSLLAKPDSRDTWNGFIEEREEIFQYLADHDIEGVVLLSADRHRTEIWKNEREGTYPLYEFLSSRLTNIHTHDTVPGSIVSYNEKCSFGMLTFDTSLEDPKLTFQIISIDGEAISSFNLKKSELSN